MKGWLIDIDVRMEWNPYSKPLVMRTPYIKPFHQLLSNEDIQCLAMVTLLFYFLAIQIVKEGLKLKTSYSAKHSSSDIIPRPRTAIHKCGVRIVVGHEKTVCHFEGKMCDAGVQYCKCTLL